jgi:hypothetical protein
VPRSWVTQAVICSIDKDLRQIPGHHMVLGKGHLKVMPDGGMMRLYTQILAGDMTDNIRGCWQTGVTRSLGLSTAVR